MAGRSGMGVLAGCALAALGGAAAGWWWQNARDEGAATEQARVRLRAWEKR